MGMGIMHKGARGVIPHLCFSSLLAIRIITNTCTSVDILFLFIIVHIFYYSIGIFHGRYGFYFTTSGFGYYSPPLLHGSSNYYWLFGALLILAHLISLNDCR